MLGHTMFNIPIIDLKSRLGQVKIKTCFTSGSLKIEGGWSFYFLLEKGSKTPIFRTIFAVFGEQNDM